MLHAVHLLEVAASLAMHHISWQLTASLTTPQAFYSHPCRGCPDMISYPMELRPSFTDFTFELESAGGVGL